LKQQLQSDPKERSENIMIVDLVRNDLSRIAKKGTVKVSELCGIHTFETVHQMISTVECEVEEDLPFMDIVKASFPMGSMTGAPKVEAMKIIDEAEDFSRGIYSGSIGYISPNGDFDFNVVIRSMIYNIEKKYLSCSVGGAITILSDPEKEYEECQTKIKKILNGMYAE
jgi:para-aminobenzoate synthetase component 1